MTITQNKKYRESKRSTGGYIKATVEGIKQNALLRSTDEIEADRKGKGDRLERINIDAQKMRDRNK